MEIACSCAQWPGPHSHTAPRIRVRLDNGVETTLPVDALGLNPGRTFEILEEIPEGIRPWVDWKQVARDQMIPPTL